MGGNDMMPGKRKLSAGWSGSTGFSGDWLSRLLEGLLESPGRFRFAVLLAAFAMAGFTLFFLPVSAASIDDDDIVVEPDFKFLELNLEEALRLGMTYSPLLKVSEGEVRKALAAIQEARAGYWPRISTRVSYNFLDEDKDVEFSVPQDLREDLARSRAFFDLDTQLAAAREKREQIEFLLRQGNYVYTIPDAQVKTARLDSPLLWGDGETDVNSVLAGSALASPIPSFSQTYSSALAAIPLRIREDIVAKRNMQVEAFFIAPVFTFGKLSHSVRRAEAGLRKAKYEEIRTRHRVAMMITEAFYDSLHTLHTQKEIEGILEKARSFEVQTSAGSSGKVPTSSIRAVKSSVARLSGMAKKAQMLHEARNDYLKAVMGVRDPMVSVRFVGGYRDFRLLENFNLQTCVAYALQHRPEIKALDEALKMADEGVKVNQSMYFPQIGLGGSYTYTRSYKDDWFSTIKEKNGSDWKVGFTADLDIFDGFEKSARINMLSEEIKKLKAERSWARQMVKAEVSKDYYDIFANFENRRSLEEAITASREASTGAIDGFTPSAASVREVIEALKDETDTALSLLSSTVEYYKAFARMKASLGYPLEGDGQ